MTSKEVFDKIDANLDSIITKMIDRFGNEGSDIGDAGSVYELLGNTIPSLNCEHDSYTIPQFLIYLAMLADVPLSDLALAYIEMTTWTAAQWVEVQAWKGFVK